ncbi:MAG: hypothetical protein SPE35_00420 [Butyricicoccus sp.]|nr:hypothetical protein [Butyricicoccus sp.]
MMQKDRYWKYGCFGIAVCMLLRGVQTARQDILLRKCCKTVLAEVQHGFYGLYLLILLIGAFFLFAVWQWITGKPSVKRMAAVSLAAVAVYGMLTLGYQSYHDDVYDRSPRSEQKKYDWNEEKGLWYDLRGLFR